HRWWRRTLWRPGFAERRELAVGADGYGTLPSGIERFDLLLSQGSPADFHPFRSGSPSENSRRSISEVGVVAATTVSNPEYETRQCWGGGGVIIIMHGGSRMTMDPRIPTVPGRSMKGFHRPGR
ncbi:unnamed protein product, partial [Laminaria digitata]